MVTHPLLLFTSGCIEETLCGEMQGPGAHRRIPARTALDRFGLPARPDPGKAQGDSRMPNAPSPSSDAPSPSSVQGDSRAQQERKDLEVTGVPKAVMEEMVNLDSPALPAPLVPLDLEETLLLSLMEEKAATPDLDPWDPKDSQDMLESLESPDKLALLVLVDLLDPLASPVRMVTTADLASLVTEVAPELRVTMVWMDAKESLVQLVLRYIPVFTPFVTYDLLSSEYVFSCFSHRVRLVPMELMETQDQLVLLEQLAPLVSLEPLAPRERLELLDPMAHPDLREAEESPVLMEPLAPSVPMVTLVTTVSTAPRELLVSPVLLEPLVSQAQEEVPAPRAPKDPLELEALVVTLDPLDKREILVLRESLVTLVSRVPLVPLVRRAREAQLARLVPPGPLVCVELEEVLELGVCLVWREEVVPLVCPELAEPPALVVSVDPLVMPVVLASLGAAGLDGRTGPPWPNWTQRPARVAQAPMATMEPPARLELLVTLVRRESRDPLVLLVSRVCPAPLDLLVRLAKLATKVCPETRDSLDPLVSRESVETPVLLALLDLREPSVLVDLLELQAPMVARESLVLSVLLVAPDTKDPVACPVSAVPVVLLDPRVRRVRVDTEDLRVTWEEMAPVVPPDQVDPLDLPVLMVKRVNLAPSALPDLLVFVDPMESVERVDLPDLPASPDPL
ncbi:unnamed protein product [Coregonus sp. 'balchen']|nr:unnamed protein product [Coregonus sp. 'balchen']